MTKLRVRRPTGSRQDGFTESMDYLSSVSDVMAGLLFVFILVLIVFAIQFQGQTNSLAKTQVEQTAVIDELTHRADKQLG